MTPAETIAWQSGFRNDRDFRFFEPAPGAPIPPNNDALQFGSEVAKLTTKMAGTVSGVIVSPDAFFRIEKKSFADAMSSLNVPICYPFTDYHLRTNPPDPVTDQLLKGSAVLSNPNGANPQQTAYYRF